MDDKGLDKSDAFFLVGEASSDDLFPFMWYGCGRRGQLAVEYLVTQLQQVACVKGVRIRKVLVDDAPVRPYIGGESIVRFLSEKFGRHVAGRSADGHQPRIVQRAQFRKAKVAELESVPLSGFAPIGARFPV